MTLILPEINYKKKYRVSLAPTLDQHWYYAFEQKVGKKGKVTEKEIGIFPSATTILNAYPQSPHLNKWIADQGWNEAQRIKSAAGERGTAVHKAVEYLLMVGSLAQDQHIDGVARPFSLDEWSRICAFSVWYQDTKPEIIALETPVFSKQGGYAGTFDCLARVNGQLGVIDWKTSSSIHDHFPLQFAAYAKALEENTDLEIEFTAALQLGAKNKNNYRFKMYSDWREHYKVFENVRAVWQYDYFDSKEGSKEPPVLILPSALKIHND